MGTTVYRFDLDGTRHVVHRFEDDEDPGGLGWLPDGRLLVAGRSDGSSTGWQTAAVVHADLTELAPFEVNDMIVGGDGTAYVTQFGFSFAEGPSELAPTTMIRVSPTGTVSPAADGLLVPNGVAITADGHSVVVAESGGGRLSVYSLRDGALVDRSEVPVPITDAMPFASPDGICLDGRWDLGGRSSQPWS
jgi:sugar lactone lactonase YvrE